MCLQAPTRFDTQGQLIPRNLFTAYAIHRRSFVHLLHRFRQHSTADIYTPTGCLPSCIMMIFWFNFVMTLALRTGPAVMLCALKCMCMSFSTASLLAQSLLIIADCAILEPSRCMQYRYVKVWCDRNLDQYLDEKDAA